jgi:penicillin-binding protein 1B
MIGLVKGPSWYYDPRRNPGRATERRNFVLGELHETGLIDDKEYQRACQGAAGRDRERRHGLAANRFPAYVDLVRRQLARDYPRARCRAPACRVMTGMSPSAQAYAEGAVTRTLKSLENKRRPPLQAGVVVTDVHNGDVLAVVGSRDVSPSRASTARWKRKRPVGSLLKPFVYLLALAQPDKWSLASTGSDDAPVTVQPGTGAELDAGQFRWSQPRHRAPGRCAGPVLQPGHGARGHGGRPERLAELIRVLAGIEAEPNPSLILGATDQSPYAMAQLYQFLASGGEIQPLHAVRGVLDPNGKLLKRYDKRRRRRRKGDSIAANLVRRGPAARW